MNFTRLEKDLAHVSGLPDTPTLEDGYTPKALKETFDRAGEDIKEYINSVLISELETDGANKIGSGNIETVEGVTVQDKLKNLAGQIQDISNASIPTGTLVPEKFIPSVAAFLSEGSLRCECYSEAGEYVFSPTRTGIYKITVQGAGSGGGTTGTHWSSCGGGSGAAAIGWLRLESGTDYTLRVGRGGNPVALNSESRYVADAENGEASGFYLGDTELLFAEGGSINLNTNRIPVARGGKINVYGGFPAMTKYASGINYYEMGAASCLSSATASRTVTAGAGAGGYGASRLEGTYYTYSGSAGGDGAILIEWME